MTRRRKHAAPPDESEAELMSRQRRQQRDSISDKFGPGPGLPSLQYLYEDAKVGDGQAYDLLKKHWNGKYKAHRKQAWMGWGGPAMNRVAGWDFDHRLNGYITTAADKFSCDCGEEFPTPSGYRKCGSCGRAWNSYVIGSDGHGKEAALEKVIVREIPVRKDVIVAAKKPAKGRPASDYINDTGPDWPGKTMVDFNSPTWKTDTNWDGSRYINGEPVFPFVPAKKRAKGQQYFLAHEWGHPNSWPGSPDYKEHEATCEECATNKGHPGAVEYAGGKPMSRRRAAKCSAGCKCSSGKCCAKGTCKNCNCGKEARRRQATGLGYSNSDYGQNPGVGNPGYGEYMTQRAKDNPQWWEHLVGEDFDGQLDHHNLEYMHTDYSPLYARPDVVVQKGLADKAPPIPGYYTEDQTWEEFSKQNPAAASKAQFDRRQIIPEEAIRQHRADPTSGSGYPVSKSYAPHPENQWKMPDYEAEAAERDQQYQDWKRSRKANARQAKGDCQCWDGYERVPGTKPCAKGSCRKCDGHRNARRYVAWCRQVDRLPNTRGFRRFLTAERIIQADRHNLRRRDLKDMTPEERKPEEEVTIEHFSSRRQAKPAKKPRGMDPKQWRSENQRYWDTWDKNRDIDSQGWGKPEFRPDKYNGVWDDRPSSTGIAGPRPGLQPDYNSPYIKRPDGPPLDPRNQRFRDPRMWPGGEAGVPRRGRDKWDKAPSSTVMPQPQQEFYQASRRQAELFDITDEGETQAGKGKKSNTPTMRKNPANWSGHKQNGQFTKRWN